ncbi:Cysteine proteinase inhibitor 1 like [Actinidia chinensis var. chinensis]|uniref:Cysteine proteinase inhibitor 1 n=1 Tax=Actinidia chinensis var. chinensis TaxID=1590841 RepID=CYT1_ACTCC|nr:RecName: Full=Cysteine proteinase inhibitor 1; Short=KCPI1; AltName: Full=Phytocystatin; Flags: Precursor [Actinidia chinensis var. chinensis]PSS04667.1 Cysteine proteinase inhibitor 1 like [Actinidia chinensis var. chinensis]
MVPKPLSLLLLLLLALSAAVVGGRKRVAAGGWRPIENLNSAEVQDVAQFAVSEHNKQANDELQYQSVVRGYTQVVAGTNYRLVIAAKDGAVVGNYEAVVWDKPWMHFRNLTSFRKV